MKDKFKKGGYFILLLQEIFNLQSLKNEWQKKVEKTQNEIRNLENFLQLTSQKNPITRKKLINVKTKLTKSLL